jgi:ABC-type branched-subunit amino acid transport system ATPase component
VIRKLADQGEMAIVLVEQFYDFAEELADNYTVMARGQVIAQDKVRKCLKRDKGVGGDLIKAS